jgi:hypothetical protein
MVDEDPSHHRRGQGQEVRPVLAGDRTLLDESDVRLVDQGRGLERMAGSFPPHVGAGQETELVVDKGKELVDSLAAFGLTAQSLLR